MLPSSWSPAATIVPIEFGGMIFITVHPDRISPIAFGSVDTVIAPGDSASESTGEFAKSIKFQPPQSGQLLPQPGQALVWFRKLGNKTTLAQIHPTRGEGRRYRRSHWEGQLAPEQSCFCGLEHKLNLRAQNLMTFMQL